jgi:hypothetical protein
LNDDAMNTTKVENHEIPKTGGIGAHIAMAVTKFDDETEGGECRFLEETTVPFLEYTRK